VSMCNLNACYYVQLNQLTSSNTPSSLTFETVVHSPLGASFITMT